MKKKVLILVSGNYNGAIAKCSWNIYDAFKRAGEYDVKCILLRRVKGGMVEYDDVECFAEEKHGIFYRVFPLLEKVKWLRKIKKDFQPDYTISTLFSVNTINALSGGRDIKIGIFHSPHQQSKVHGWLRYTLNRMNYLLFYPKLDKLACVSTEVQNSLYVFPTISKNKIEVIYNVHDVANIIRKGDVNCLTDDEMKIFSHPTILYCGRLDTNKAPDRALMAFAKAVKPTNAQFAIIGVDKDGLLEKLHAIAKEYGIEDKVHFLGKKDNPYAYMKRATALVSSSYSEGLPGVMIESLILGKPVVTTNSSKGIWEIFSIANLYSKDMNGIVESDCGIISSNNSFVDKTLFDKDIENLSKAISKIWNFGNVKNFAFQKNVEGSEIVQQLIK